MRKAITLAMAIAMFVSLTTTANAAPTGNALQTNAVREVVVTGVFGVPSDAAAVVLNVTAVDSAGAGFATVYPCGSAVPLASNLNVTNGQTVPNAVIVRPGADGKVCVFGSATLDLIVDISGYFPAGSTSQFLASPTRILSTRDGVGAGVARVAAGATLQLLVQPPSGATAAILNVTVTNTAAAGFVTVFPCDQPVPQASNLNFTAGQTVPNLVMAKPSSTGKICFFTSATTDIIADLTGWTSNGFAPLPVPSRVLSTRDGFGAPRSLVGAGSTFTLPVAAPVGATAAVLNVTVTNAKAAGFLTVYPCGSSTPTASNLNYSAGQTVANLVVVRPGGGSICFFTSSAVDVLADLAGWMTTGYEPLVPVRAADSRQCSFMVYQDDETTTNPAIKYETKYYTKSTTTGIVTKIIDEIGYNPGPNTSFGYGLPLIGTDCYIYIVAEVYTHPDATTFTTTSLSLLRVNPQTGERLKLTDMTTTNYRYLVGRNPVSGEMYLADALGPNDSQLYTFNPISKELSPAGRFSGAYLVGSQDMQHIYFQAFDGGGVQRQLIEATAGGSTRILVTGGLDGGLAFRSPDGNQLLISGATTSTVVDLSSGATHDVTAQRPIGWSPDSYVAVPSTDYKTISVTRPGLGSTVLLTAPPASNHGISILTTGP